MNPSELLPIFCELLLKSALVLAAAALIERALFRASAAKASLVWTVALCAVLLIPFTRLAEPRWPVTMTSAVVTRLPEAVKASAPATAAVPAVSPSPVGSARWEMPGWRAVTVGAWGFGAALMLVSSVVARLRLRRLRKASEPVRDARLLAMAARDFRELQISRRVELRLSAQTRVPLTWGTLRPVVMLPAGCTAWDDARLAAALRHELGHVARGDHFTRSIAWLACSIYWPNPLAWLALRALRRSQEEATDDLVLRAGTAPEEYAGQLFDLARNLVGERSLAGGTVAMASRSTLERRMLAIVDPQRDRRPVTLRAVSCSVLTMLAALGLCTTAQLRAKEKPAASNTVDENAPQLLITATFVEVPDAVLKSEPGLALLAGTSRTLSPAQLENVMSLLHSTKGADVLSSPRVTTRSGQRAMVQIGREVLVPKDWKKEGSEWKSSELEQKFVGESFDILATVGAEEAIALEMNSTATVWTGFVDLDTGARYPAPAASHRSGEAPLDASAANVPAGHRAEALFATRKIDTKVNVKAGETIVFGGTAPGDDAAKDSERRQLAVLVTPTLVQEKPKTAQTTITSDSLTLDNKTGEIKATGNVTIDTPSARIDAPEATVKTKPATGEDPASAVIIPRMELAEATLAQSVEFLVAKARASALPDFNVVVLGKPDPELKITISLTSIPLSEALRYVAELSGLRLRRDAAAYVLEPTK